MTVDAHLYVVFAAIESRPRASALPPTEQLVVLLVAREGAVTLALVGVRQLAASEPLGRGEDQRTGQGRESEVAEESGSHWTEGILGAPDSSNAALPRGHGRRGRESEAADVAG